MSKSSNRHPAETYDLRDTPRLWHTAGPALPPFGCSDCIHRPMCGGLQIDMAIFNCVTFCRCADPATCDNVCPRNPQHLVARRQEVRGFELANVPMAPRLVAPGLPTFVPMIYHGASRLEPLHQEAVALPLGTLVTRRNGRLRFTSRAALLERFRLHDTCQILVSGTDVDPTIEGWWGAADRESVIVGLRALGVTAITSPNYSLFVEVPRHDNLYNMKRIALAWSELQREGLPAALHVNARTDRDWERWAEFIAARPEVTMVAFEFGTGAGAKGRIGWHVDQLVQLAGRVRRPLMLLARGGVSHLTMLAAAYERVIYIDTTAFVKTVQRRRAELADDMRVTWKTAPTSKDEPIDALLRHNLDAWADFVRLQVVQAKPAAGELNVAGWAA